MTPTHLLGVSSDYAQPITGQITEVTCPVIGRAQPELTLSERQKMGPGGMYCTTVFEQGQSISSDNSFSSERSQAITLIVDDTV